MANYFLPPLKSRVLRIDLDSPTTAYRWFEEYCARKIIGICVKHSYREHIEHDFDFTKKEDRLKMNEMGFVCKVREKPSSGL